MYTYAGQMGNFIISRGYEDDGKRFIRKEDFFPTLFTYSSKANTPTEWSDIHGEPVYEVNPGSIRDCRDFIQQYKDVSGFTVLGNTTWYLQWISDNYPGTLKADLSRIRTKYIDIETSVSDGFPDYRNSKEEILLITVYDNNVDEYVVYTATDVVLNDDLLIKKGVDPSKIKLEYQMTEKEMLRKFIADWSFDYPDIITGWNTEGFDIPYLVNRCNLILGEKITKKLSPFGTIKERTVTVGSKENVVYDIVGISHLDYIILMRKYTYGVRDSWKLDDIAKQELGEEKLEYEGTFRDFYTNNFYDFTTYNIIDTHLVKKLDDKLKLVDLLMTIAYDAKVCPEDVYSQLKTWDALIYNYLKDKKVVISNKEYHSKVSYEGAYVMDPKIGKHKWIMSYDLQSLYPHLILQYNMSPETLTEHHFDTNVAEIMERKKDLSLLPELNVAMSANGVCYDKSKHGFMPELIDRIYNKRSKAKKEMLRVEQEYETTKDENLVSKISQLNNTQMAAKILINSLYGALGSNHFRFYDLRMAEGITLSGQLAIKWVGRDINIIMNKLCKTNDVDYLVYGDTDSVYVTFEKFVEIYYKNLSDLDVVKKLDEISDKIIQPAINKSYDRMGEYLNVYDQKMIMKREAIADTGVFVAKKKYALSVHNSEGVQYEKPKLKSTGLDLVRSSTPAVVREYLYDGIREVLYGTEQTVQKYISKCKENYMTLPYQSIAFPRGVNGLEKFTGSPIYSKGCPIHVRGSLLFNHYLKKLELEGDYEAIQEGNKIRFIYLKLPNRFKENVIAYLTELPKPFNIESSIDYELMFQKSFVESIKSIMEPLGWNPEEQNTLEDFFG